MSGSDTDTERRRICGDSVAGHGGRLRLRRDQRSPDPGGLTLPSMDHRVLGLRELRAA